MYKLSRDYKKLFNLIEKGAEIAAWADYRSINKEKPLRDICSVKRWKPYQINIGSRGISYGDVYPFESEEGPEIDVFIQHCESANLEWIDPT